MGCVECSIAVTCAAVGQLLAVGLSAMLALLVGAATALSVATVGGGAALSVGRVRGVVALPAVCCRRSGVPHPLRMPSTLIATIGPTTRRQSWFMRGAPFRDPGVGLLVASAPPQLCSQQLGRRRWIDEREEVELQGLWRRNVVGTGMVPRPCDLCTPDMATSQRMAKRMGGRCRIWSRIVIGSHLHDRTCHMRRGAGIARRDGGAA